MQLAVVYCNCSYDEGVKKMKREKDIEEIIREQDEAMQDLMRVINDPYYLEQKMKDIDRKYELKMH